MDSDPYNSAKSAMIPQGQDAMCRPTVCLLSLLSFSFLVLQLLSGTNDCKSRSKMLSFNSSSPTKAFDLPQERQ